MPTVIVTKKSLDLIRSQTRAHEQLPPAYPARKPGHFMIKLDRDVFDALQQLDPDIDRAIEIATSPTFNPTKH